ncbi:hypothetical protein [Lysinibacillus antri]|uniref:Uncharacterized protein n=1 Tax=Lysinibacillus antri TaxID=2498145 RepID=A0A3S0R4F7_9BACI|nr:hypothetical protein [Lysinibacillus antri]RUL48628.1 hypothetical protein EK386_16820 [Lysinibacillus antri]
MATNNKGIKDKILNNFHNIDSVNRINLRNAVFLMENKVKNYIIDNIDNMSSEELLLFKEILELLVKVKKNS